MSDAPAPRRHTWFDGKPFGRPEEFCTRCGVAKGNQAAQGPCDEPEPQSVVLNEDYDPWGQP